METLKNIGEVSKTEALLADIAISLSLIADSIEGVIRVENVVTEPTHYVFMDYGGNGGCRRKDG